MKSISKSGRLLLVSFATVVLCGCVLMQPMRTVRYVKYPVKKGDTLYEIAKRFDVSTSELMRVNKLNDPYALKLGQLVKVPYFDAPGASSKPATADGYKPVSMPAPNKNSMNTVKLTRAKKHVGNLHWPVKTGNLSSTFGRRWFSFHEGIDIRASNGTPIYSAHDGTVVYSGSGLKGYGNLVIVRGDAILTVYAHNRSNKVRVGQKVDKGDIIAYVGDTGKATGPHLHFETRIKDSSGLNVAVDPLVFYGTSA